MDKRLEQNQRSWNERTPVHVASSFYDVAGFKAGRITLHDIERREVGAVDGKSLLHLQCHFGLDTMSWARLGARATGVDFSDAALAAARRLNAELELPVRFIECNVYDLPGRLDEQFDIVYTGLGVLCWLPDLDAWARVVAHFLKPGGKFYLFDTHPLLGVFESAASAAKDASSADLRVKFGYFPDPAGMYFEGGEPSYAGTDIIEAGVYEWAHSVAEILAAVRNAGLQLEFFHEFPVNCYKAFPGMERIDGWWRFPHHNHLPLSFSLAASKPSDSTINSR